MSIEEHLDSRPWLNPFATAHGLHNMEDQSLSLDRLHNIFSIVFANSEHSEAALGATTNMRNAAMTQISLTLEVAM
ncbi:hypothetical protein COLO4_16563 [Corchorus olitorius]|uniref:Uncharacterized protein n=1 Tax=Corchorus olitorius TaxID=93759 RepID=A0A1R3JGQ3_9ROSI|nr:hypothetical protein COLO4_16563 [Corchorus olitorius]